MAEVVHAGHHLKEGGHKLDSFMKASDAVSEHIRKERMALLASGKYEFDAEEKALIDHAKRSKTFWICFFIIIFLAITSVLIWLCIEFSKHELEIVELFSLYGLAVAFIAGVGASVVFSVSKNLKKQLRYLSCKSGGYLLKSTISEEQWASFQEFDSKNRCINAFGRSFAGFFLLTAAVCLGVLIFGSDIEGFSSIYYAYAVLLCLIAALLFFVCSTGYTLIRRIQLMNQTDRDVFIFRDAIVFQGNYISWSTSSFGEPEYGAKYLGEFAIVEYEEIGNMIKLRRFKITEKKGKKEKKFEDSIFIPIATSDCKAASLALELSVDRSFFV